MSLNQEALEYIHKHPHLPTRLIAQHLTASGYSKPGTAVSCTTVQRARKKMQSQAPTGPLGGNQLVEGQTLGKLTKDQLFDKLQHEEAERQAQEAVRAVEKRAPVAVRGQAEAALAFEREGSSLRVKDTYPTPVSPSGHGGFTYLLNTAHEFASAKAKEMFDGEVKRAKKRLAHTPTPVNGTSHRQPSISQDVAATARDFAATLKDVEHFSPDKYQLAFESMTRDQQKSFLDAVVNEVGGSSDFKKGYATALEGSILILQRELARVKGAS